MSPDRAGVRACARCGRDTETWSFVVRQQVCQRCYSGAVREALDRTGRVKPIAWRSPPHVASEPIVGPDHTPWPATEAIADGTDPRVRLRRRRPVGRRMGRGPRDTYDVSPPAFRTTEVTAAAPVAPRVEVAAPRRSGWSCDECGQRFPSRVEPNERAGDLFCRDCL